MTMTIVAATVDSAPRPTIRLNVTSSPGVTDALRIYRVHADGTRYRVLTENRATLVNTWTGFDYHCPFNQFVSYIAETDSLTSPASARVLLVSIGNTWLVHQSQPLLSLRTGTVMELADYKYADRSTKFEILNRKLPIHRNDLPRSGESGVITVKCPDPAARAAMKALLADGGPILINTPYTDDELGWKWVQPGDLTLHNPAGKTWFLYREASFPYVETTQPDVDSLPIFTDGDLTAAYATDGAATAAYATDHDMQLNVA